MAPAASTVTIAWLAIAAKNPAGELRFEVAGGGLPLA